MPRRRPSHPRFKRTRDTHDPQTTLPTSLTEQLALSAPAPAHAALRSSHAAQRKALRKQKRQEKKRGRHHTVLDPAAQSPVHHGHEASKNETVASGANGAGEAKQTPNRKRVRVEPVEAKEQDDTKNVVKDIVEDRQPVIDNPDAREARRLEKLLGIKRKKKRKVSKGMSFAYSDAFGEDDDIVDLLEFCDNTIAGAGAGDVGAFGEDSDNEDNDGEGENGADDKNIKVEDEKEVDSNDESADYNQGDSIHEDSEGSDIFSQQDESEDGDEREHRLVSPRIVANGKHDNDAGGDDGSSDESLSSDGDEQKQKPDSHGNTVRMRMHEERVSSPPPKKYVPPSARGRGDAATLVKRRMRGLLNRVADANASNIASDIIQLFQGRQEQSMTQTIADTYAQCTLDAVRDGSGAGYVNPYLQSHASIASHVTSRVGHIVLASLLVSAVRRFHRELPMLEAESELLNDGASRSDVYGYTALLVSLYERRAVSCSIVYDLVRTIGNSLSSERLGLLLALLRQVGPLLRQDDPRSLKDMIEFIHSQADKVTNCLETTAEQGVSLKLQIMLDLIDDIKNNRVKRSALQAASEKHSWAEAPDPPLSASLSDLLDDAFISRRWWYANDINGLEMTEGRDLDEQEAIARKDMEKEPNMNNLASSLRLSTGRRKDIFKVVMASPNVSEAYERLQDMGAFDTKKHYDRDTAIVILHCCGSEKIFNPFYAYLAERMCKRARRSRFTFEFACWDIFKSVPASAKKKAMSKRRARNFEHLLAHLWCSQALSLSVLRYAQDFEECGENEIAFYSGAIEILFSKLALDRQNSAEAPFERMVSETWNGADAFRVTLGLFLRRTLRPRLGGAQSKLLKRALQILEDVK